MKKLLWIAASVLFLVSCGEEPEKKATQTSTGKTAEILVVVPGEPDIDGMLGDTVSYVFSQEFPIVPRPEPVFDVAFVPRNKFENSDILKTHHNILFLETDPSYLDTKFEKSEDVWAKFQLLVRLKAQDKSHLIQALLKHSDDIIDLFTKNEIRRLQAFMKPYLDNEIIDILKETYGIRLDVPKGFYIAKKHANFAWLRRETPKTSEGILIYFYPYEDTAVITHKKILALRDSITKMYVPGPTPDSYMTIEHRFYPPVTKKIRLFNKTVYETRGLWRVENDFMGGAFIHYTFTEPEKKRVIHLDGFVYNPESSNRDMIIRLAAILQTYKSL